MRNGPVGLGGAEAYDVAFDCFFNSAQFADVGFIVGA